MRAIEEHGPGSYTVGGERAGQPEYFPLEVVRRQDGALWSAWKPGVRERIRILFGAAIRVGVLAVRQPPIKVDLDLPPEPTPISTLTIRDLEAAESEGLR